MKIVVGLLVCSKHVSCATTGVGPFEGTQKVSAIETLEWRSMWFCGLGFGQIVRRFGEFTMTDYESTIIELSLLSPICLVSIKLAD